MVKKESVEMFLATFLHVCRPAIIFCKNEDPIITHCNGHGIITPLPAGLNELCTDRYHVE